MRSSCEIREEKKIFIRQRQGRGPGAKNSPKLSHGVMETRRAGETVSSLELPGAGVFGEELGLKLGIWVGFWKATGGC